MARAKWLALRARVVGELCLQGADEHLTQVIELARIDRRAAERAVAAGGLHPRPLRRERAERKALTPLH